MDNERKVGSHSHISMHISPVRGSTSRHKALIDALTPLMYSQSNLQRGGIKSAVAGCKYCVPCIHHAIHRTVYRWRHHDKILRGTRWHQIMPVIN